MFYQSSNAYAHYLVKVKMNKNVKNIARSRGAGGITACQRSQAVTDQTRPANTVVLKWNNINYTGNEYESVNGIHPRSNQDKLMLLFRQC